MFSQTTATTKILKMNARKRIIQGGTSASKTVSIILILIAMAQSDKKKTLTSIVSESFTHLRRVAERYFLTIIKEHQCLKDKWCKWFKYHEANGY